MLETSVDALIVYHFIYYLKLRNKRSQIFIVFWSVLYKLDTTIGNVHDIQFYSAQVSYFVQVLQLLQQTRTFTHNVHVSRLYFSRVQLN